MEDKFMKSVTVANGEKNLVSPFSEIRNVLIQLLKVKGIQRGLTFPCLNVRS